MNARVGDAVQVEVGVVPVPTISMREKHCGLRREGNIYMPHRQKIFGIAQENNHQQAQPNKDLNRARMHYKA